MNRRGRRETGVQHLLRTVLKKKVQKSDILNVYNSSVDKLPELIALINQHPEIILKAPQEPFNEVPPEWDNFSVAEIDENAFKMAFFSQESVFEEKLTVDTLESLIKQELFNGEAHEIKKIMTTSKQQIEPSAFQIGTIEKGLSQNKQTRETTEPSKRDPSFAGSDASKKQASTTDITPEDLKLLSTAQDAKSLEQELQSLFLSIPNGSKLKGSIEPAAKPKQETSEPSLKEAQNATDPNDGAKKGNFLVEQISPTHEFTAGESRGKDSEDQGFPHRDINDPMRILEESQFISNYFYCSSVNPYQMDISVKKKAMQCFEEKISPPGLFNNFDEKTVPKYCEIKNKVFSIFAFEDEIFDRVWFYKDAQKKVQGPFSSFDMDIWKSDRYFSAKLLVSFKNFTYFPLYCFENRVSAWKQEFIYLQQNPRSFLAGPNASVAFPNQAFLQMNAGQPGFNGFAWEQASKNQGLNAGKKQEKMPQGKPGSQSVNINLEDFPTVSESLP